MIKSERGFTFIEMLVALTIIIFIVGSASITAYQVFNASERSNEHTSVIRQVQNAGYWISQDALMAETVVLDDDPATELFLTLTWSEWSFGPGEDTVYHSVTYTIQDLSGGAGKLIRTYSIDDVVNEQYLVAKYIVYDPDSGGVGDVTWATYAYPVLTMQIASSLGDASEIREYEIWHRRDF